MKYSKLMRERIRRVHILFKELGYTILEGEYIDETYTGGFEKEEGFQGGYFIDRDSKFLELAFTFSFSPSLADFIKQKLDDMLKICYEYGVYVNIQNSQNDISFSVFTKIYFAGLNYYSLKETIKDFRETVDSLQDLLEIKKEFGGEEGDDNT